MQHHQQWKTTKNQMQQQQFHIQRIHLRVHHGKRQPSSHNILSNIMQLHGSIDQQHRYLLQFHQDIKRTCYQSISRHFLSLQEQWVSFCRHYHKTPFLNLLCSRSRCIKCNILSFSLRKLLLLIPHFFIPGPEPRYGGHKAKLIHQLHYRIICQA